MNQPHDAKIRGRMNFHVKLLGQVSARSLLEIIIIIARFMRASGGNSLQSSVSPSQKAASALRRAECALRNWQDDPSSPRQDVDRMLAILNDLRGWVQGHVLFDIERFDADHSEHNTEIRFPEKPV